MTRRDWDKARSSASVKRYGRDRFRPESESRDPPPHEESPEASRRRIQAERRYALLDPLTDKQARLDGYTKATLARIGLTSPPAKLDPRDGLLGLLASVLDTRYTASSAFEPVHGEHRYLRAARAWISAWMEPAGTPSEVAARLHRLEEKIHSAWDALRDEVVQSTPEASVISGLRSITEERAAAVETEHLFILARFTAHFDADPRLPRLPPRPASLPAEWRARSLKAPSDSLAHLVTPLLVFEVELATRDAKVRLLRMMQRAKVARTATTEEQLERLDRSCDAVHIDGRTRRR